MKNMKEQEKNYAKIKERVSNNVAAAYAEDTFVSSDLGIAVVNLSRQYLR